MMLDFFQTTGSVLSNLPVAQDIYLMRLHAPRIARVIQTFQFLQIQTDLEPFPLLRRPFSVLRVDRDQGWIDILYDIIGPGTQKMATASLGNTFSLLGPLGIPFSPPTTDHLLLVAGGIGLVPLAFLSWEKPLTPKVFLMGGANRDRMPQMNQLLPPSQEIHFATNDGSLGHKGFVTELISLYAIPGKTTIFTCGPTPMMAKVASIASEYHLPCYASLENHMACGFGACVGCVIEFHNTTQEDDRYRRVCIEGPVVDAHAVVW